MTPPTFTITFTIKQLSALIKAIATCLTIAQKSHNLSMAYGIDPATVIQLNACLTKLDEQIPEPSTETPCTHNNNTSTPSSASL
jgi:hypothetical protein